MPVDPKPPVPPRRWVRRILLVLGGLVFVVWLAPIVAAWTPLVSWLCAKAAKPINGTVHVASASLGWFSPVRLHGVEIRDPDGNPIVRIPQIETDRSLLLLLLNLDDVGTIRLDRPTIDLTFGKDESNLEKVLDKSLLDSASAPSDDKPSAWKLPQMRVEIVEATLSFHDSVSGHTWLVRSLTISAIFSRENGNPIQLDVRGATHDGTEAGSLKAEILVQNAGAADASATIKTRFSSFPVALAGIAARRYCPGLQLLGSLQGQGTINLALKDGKPHADFTGELIANHVTLTAPSLADTLYVERLRFPCTLRLEDRKLVAGQAEAESEFGKLRVHGWLDLGADWRANFDQSDFDLAADVDLQTLGQRLPKTLHLHQDLRLEGGRLSVQCKSRRQGDTIAWQGRLRTSALLATRRGQPIAWPEPIAFDIEVRDPHKATMTVDHLACSARFLRVEGVPAPDGFLLSAEADLQQLAEPLGQFVDLAGVKLAGKAKGAVTVRRTEADRFLVQGDMQIKQMNLTGITGQPWQDESASATFAARGRADSAGRQHIDSANAEVKLGSDRIAVTLTEPIPDLMAGPWGSLTVNIGGDLARWQRRARSFTTSLDDLKIAGQGDAQVQVRPLAHSLDCTSARIVATNLRLTAPGFFVQEPTFMLQTAARWDARTGAIELTQTKAACPTVAFDTGKFSIQPATRTIRGSANVAGDLARLRNWTHDPHTKPGEPIEGTLVGRIALHASPSRCSADFDLTLKNFSQGNADHPTWREAEAKCVGRAVYESGKDAFHLEKLQIAGAAFNADAAGTIANFSGRREVDLTGTLAYDLEKLEPQLRHLLGKDVKIAGKDTRTFKVAGPLYPNPPAMSFKELKGRAGLHWTSLKAFGCDVGPAELKAVMQQGWLQIYPIEATFNGGKLRLQPNLKLEPAPVEVILLAGPVIEQAKITRALCAGALGHAMPVLANVTDADGSISITLESGRIPLADPASGDIKGTLILHRAQVGPSPIVRELSALLKMPIATGVIKECKVPFQMANGKVQHSDFEITLGELTVKSSGAVGFDGSLALVLEMPIPPQLAAAARLTPAQAKQTIRIPVGGTLEHPRIDPRVLDSLPAALGRSLLENQLNRLLQPKR